MGACLGTIVLFAGGALVSQYPAASQVGALYSGGDNQRPKLNKSNCANNSGQVAVDYHVVTTVNPSFPQLQFGVMYVQDVAIPAPMTSYIGSSGGMLQSPVSCAEPTAEQIVQDNIALFPGQLAFPLSQYVINVPNVSDFMSDLCSADGGIRKRRAYCFGVRNGQGAATTVRGGDGPDIDTVPPGAPSGIRVEAGDGYVMLTLGTPVGSDSVEGAAMTYVAQARECTEAPAVDGGAVVVDAGGGDGPCGPFRTLGGPQASPVKVETLLNGHSYELRAYAVDDFGNEGPPSSTAFATPRKEYGLLDLYGGQMSGVNCRNADGVWWMVGALTAVFAVVRRAARGRHGVHQ